MKSVVSSRVARRSCLFNQRFICRASLTVVLLLAIAGLLIYVARSRAAGGDIDPAFNASGAGPNSNVRAPAVQPDGKIVIGGDFTSYNGDAAAPDFVIRLLTAPGSLAFSSATYSVYENDGNATITVKRTGGTDNQVVGKVTLADVTTSPADYRLTPGARDTAFNAGGAGANSIVNAVAVQPDGKIIVVGEFTAYNGDQAASNRVMRLNADGTRDTTFNAGGAGTNNTVWEVAVQPDGKIVIGGHFTSYNGDSDATDSVMRLNADGTRDPTFNAGGDGANDHVFAVAVQPDGKIIIGGGFTSYNGVAAASDRVMRLNADGTRDATFNAGGAGADNFVREMAVQPDGKIVIVGNLTSYNGDAAASDFVMRLNADGTRDTTFNAGGTGPNNTVYAVAVQPDGKIVIGGSFTSYNGNAAANNGVMRLNADGTRDTTFNAGGAGADAGALAVAVQPDGKIIIGGGFTSYNGDAAASDLFMRLNADGSPDTAFNVGGAGAAINPVYAVAVQPDGKIVIGGTFFSYNGDAAASDAIMRLDGDLFVTWPAGDATDKIIRLPITNDSLAEGPETLTLTLAVMSGGATLGSPSSSTLTIYEPTITFGAAPTPTYLGGNFTVSASTTNTDSSTLTYSRVSGPCALVSGATFSSSGAGTCVVRADGAATANFNAASNTQNVTIAKANQTITFGVLADKNFGDPNFSVTATSDSGLPVSFAATGQCTVTADGLTVHLKNAGSCTITASQAGDTNYAATDVSRMFTIQNPEINVKGNGVSIVDGDSTPSFIDATDFGSAVINGGSVAHVFTIENIGATALNLGGTPNVILGGTNAADFTVTVQPASSVAPGGTTTFTVVFAPGTTGLRTATLSIANNDSNENPYDFSIQGTGIVPGTLAFSSATYSVYETDGNATITVKRTGGTDNQVVGKVTLADVTTSPADYRFTPGARDTAFNSGSAGANGNVYALAVQPDGKIVIGGDFTSYNGDSAASDRVMRLNADGTRDTAFNASGAGANNYVDAVAVQPDGKIVIGGLFISYNGDAAASDYVMRLNADGTRDPTFNAGGAGASSIVLAVAVQPDGKIIIGGLFTSYNGDSAANDRLMRLNADGTRDATFNVGGAGASSDVYAVALQPDGKIVIGGSFSSYNGSTAGSGRVMRLDANGSRDTSFNAGGAAANSTFNAVAVQPDGKIVIGGEFTIHNDDPATSDNVMRLNADGKRDATFNAGGAGANLTVWGVAVQPDGKIVIGGQFTSYNGDPAASDEVMRLNADGTRDPTFNAGGAGANNTVYAVTAQPDGKIVIGGLFQTYNGDFAASDNVMRLDGDLFVTWPAGDATDKIIRLPITNDGLAEGDETLTLTLAVMSGGATLGSPSSSTLTILDPRTTPTITFGPPPTPTYLGGNFTVSATTTNTDSSTLTYSRVSGPCALVSGATFSSSGAGTCVVQADGAATTHFDAASNTQNVTISNPPGGIITFSATNYSVNESTGVVTVTLNRTGPTTAAVTLDYATDDTGANCGTLNSGLASSRCDFTAMFGTLTFAANETQKTLDIPINQDSFAEGPEVFTINLSNASGGSALATLSSPTITISDSPPPAANANDDTEAFVRQQYHDFLNRDADPAGLAFWVNNIDKCNDPAQRPPGQTLAQCLEIQRITTSAAFFLSIEFKQTGGLVRDFYVAALDRPATNNMPNFVEFTRDTQAIQRGVVGNQGNWEQTLEANRIAFMNGFVMRAEFIGLYPTTDTPTQYVDKLYPHAKVAPGTIQERLDAILEFGGAPTAADPGARGRALLRVTKTLAFQAREANPAFVHMQYIGYLRRNPNDPPDGNFNGFNFWLDKLNAFGGNYITSEMVKAFLSSIEYRQRFGP